MPSIGEFESALLVLMSTASRTRSTDPPSDSEDLSIDTLVDDLEAVRRAVAAERVSVLGWSSSGAVASRYAMDYSDHAERVLTVGWIPPRRTSTDDADLAEARRRITSRGGADRAAFVEQLRADGVDMSDPAMFAREEAMAIAATQVPDPNVFDRMKSTPWIEPNEQDSRWIAVSQRLAQTKARHVSGRLDAPTLVMYGDQDRMPLGASRDWRWTMPDARLLVLDGAGHYPWLEQPERFFADANAFLSGTWPHGAELINYQDAAAK